MAAEQQNRTEGPTTERPTTTPADGLAAAEGEATNAAVEATLTLRVPRGAMGDLPAGVRDVLAGIDGVETVDVGEIRAVRPDSFDIHVDAAARLGMNRDTTDPDAVRDRLLDGFGIEAVETVFVDVDVDVG
jgi:hypothetical protein